MDIYDYLKCDHRSVEHLFGLFEKTQLPKRQQEIVELITIKLLAHAYSEEESFYKPLTEHPNAQGQILHSEEEHHQIEQQVQLLRGLEGKALKKSVLKLKKLVKHHVKEEEGALFKQARKIFSSQEALILKERMHYLKGKFLLSLEKPEPVKKKLLKIPASQLHAKAKTLSIKKSGSRSSLSHKH